MKKDIHPEVFKDAKTTCSSCGAIYKIPATVKDQTVEVCAQCHPVYTGEYRGIIASGRVDRFRKMQEASKQKKEAIATKTTAKKAAPKAAAKKSVTKKKAKK